MILFLADGSEHKVPREERRIVIADINGPTFMVFRRSKPSNKGFKRKRPSTTDTAAPVASAKKRRGRRRTAAELAVHDLYTDAGSCWSSSLCDTGP